MSFNEQFLYDSFNLYYNKGTEAIKDGNVELAVRNVLMAAEALLKLAKASEGELQKARYQRAVRLIDLASQWSKDRDYYRQGGTVIPPEGKNGTAAPERRPQRQSEEEGTAKFIAAEVPNIHFSDVAGLDDVKQAVRIRMIYPVLHPDKYKAYNKKTGGGVLLYGPPGTGKTMIAKAIACEVGAKFYAVKSSDLVTKWVGDSEKNIDALFEQANSDDRAIIFFDELEGLLGRRGVDTHNDKRVSEFLQQIDGFSGKNGNLMILGATNRPWDIDEAARRPGRFSELIYVPLPDAAARKFIITKSLKGVPVETDVSADWLTEATDGYSGADIDELCDRAKDIPLLTSIAKDTIVKLTKSDFDEALSKVKKSVNADAVKEFEKFARMEEKIHIICLKDKIDIDPFEKPVIPFFMSAPAANIMLLLDGKKYACSSTGGNNYASEGVDADAGEYEAKVLAAGREIGFFKVKLVRGVEEKPLL